MISKKRYYGLALPIWTCSDCDAWEVIESRDELRERAVAGWDEFEGHSAASALGGRGRDRVPVLRRAQPSHHRRRQPVAGRRHRGHLDAEVDHRPRLLAGVVPRGLVTESFPGQFRNWFYALMTESTVMTGQAPFTTLFSYALLRDEHGEEMHKSKGNAIWFDDAAEQIGADVMRWMFSATAPAVNMNFGYRPGPRGGAPLLPAGVEHVRLLHHLRAARRLDAIGRRRPMGRPRHRTLLDRWILSRLEATGRRRARKRSTATTRSAPRGRSRRFVDELSNWYVRRNRRRFWKGELDGDKRAAYATLHGVLVDLTRLIAPFVPHLAEAMWQNLVAAVQPEAPDRSTWPTSPSRARASATRRWRHRWHWRGRSVALGRTARAASGVRTRQPLATARVKLPGGAGTALSADAAVAEALTAEVLDELNVKALDVLTDESGMVERTLYPLLPVIGPRHGKAVGRDHGWSAVGRVAPAGRRSRWRSVA